MDYIRWNNLVADHLFKPSRRGQEVFLCLTEDDLVRIVLSKADSAPQDVAIQSFANQKASEIIADFWKALRQGPAFWDTLPNGTHSFITGNDITDWIQRPAPRHPAELAKYAWEDWSRARLSTKVMGSRSVQYRAGRITINAPLHLLYLASFTFSFSSPDAVNAHSSHYDTWNSFFGPPRNLLKQGATVSTQVLSGLGIGVWAAMWKEVERWSQEDLCGERGMLVARQFANPTWKYVGLPLSQCLLPPLCLRRLDRQFYKFGFTAQAAPRITEDALKACLLDAGTALPVRTRDILLNNSPPEVCRAVVEQARGRLQIYNGIVKSERLPVGQGGLGQLKTGDVIEAAIGELIPFVKLSFGKPTFYHRLQPKAETDTELQLMYEGVEYSCKIGAVWSSPIESIPLSTDAVVLKDSQRPWKAVARLDEIQFFALASDRAGLPDYIAVSGPELGEILVLCQPAHANRMREWATHCGSILQDAVLAIGPATGFYFLKVHFERLTTVPNTLPISVRADKSIEPFGGLSVGRGDYLVDAMPQFKASSMVSAEVLQVVYQADGEKQFLQPVEGKIGVWSLPADLRTDVMFRVETADGAVASRPLRALRSLLPVVGQCPDVFRGLLLEDCKAPDEVASFVRGLSIEAPEAEKAKIAQRYAVIYRHYFKGVEAVGSSLAQATEAQSELNYAQADQLLYLLSARGKLDRESFREAFGIFRPDAGTEWRYAMRWFGQLGHAAYQYERGRDVLTVLPPTLSLMPDRSSGGRRFLLTGMRLPGMLKEIAEWQPAKIKVHTVAQHSANHHYLLPNAAIIETLESSSDIQVLAAAFKFQYQDWMPTTAQWLLLGGGLNHYQGTLVKADVSLLPPPTWSHQYFDLDALTMKQAYAGADGSFPYCRTKGALLAYDMRRGQDRFRLWLDDVAYMIEPSWGRYIVLKRHKRQVLQVREGKLLVPGGASLPGGIGLAASLLDGRVPDWRNIDGKGYYQYPADGAFALITNELDEKLGQRPVLVR